MRELLRGLSVLLLGQLLLVLKSSVLASWLIDPLDPLPIVPMVVFLALSSNVSLARGMILSFMLGYLGDMAQGNPLGLETFLMAFTFIAVRTLGSRLILLRNAIMQSIAVGFTAALAVGAALAIRTIFGPPLPLPLEDEAQAMMTMLGAGVATGLIAPLIFEMMRRIEALYARREEGGALA